MLLNIVLFDSFGLAIIAFTIIIRLVTFPATLRQLHSTRAMQTIQPRIAEINKKFSDPKRRQEEIMKVYRESGVNPLGCLGPMVLQFPILIALYDAVRLALRNVPGGAGAAFGASLCTGGRFNNAVPLQDHFIGMDLRTGNLLMVVLVGVTTWAQTATTVTSAATTDQQRTQQQMMAYMMPLMFAFFALNFPAGVSLYWVVNSIVGIAFNIGVYGFPRLGIEPLFKPKPPKQAKLATEAASAGSLAAATQPAQELRTANGPSRSKRQNRRRRP